MSLYVPGSPNDGWRSVLGHDVSPRIVLGDFPDDWRRTSDNSTRQRMVRDPLDDADSLEQHRWACFLAATVEYLTVRDAATTPSWVYEERWVLPEPWFLLPGWKIRAWLLVATPPPWKRRRIFGGDETVLIGRV